MESALWFAEKATRHDGKVLYLHASPNERFVRACCGKDGTIVRVRVTEAADGPYWGWEYTETPGELEFIWINRAALDMCFPYGVDAAVKNGRGRVVRLVIEEVPAPHTTETPDDRQSPPGSPLQEPGDRA